MYETTSHRLSYQTNQIKIGEYVGRYIIYFFAGVKNQGILLKRFPGKRYLVKILGKMDISADRQLFF